MGRLVHFAVIVKTCHRYAKFISCVYVCVCVCVCSVGFVWDDYVLIVMLNLGVEDRGECVSILSHGTQLDN